MHFSEEDGDVLIPELRLRDAGAENKRITSFLNGECRLLDFYSSTAKPIERAGVRSDGNISPKGNTTAHMNDIAHCEIDVLASAIPEIPIDDPEKVLEVPDNANVEYSTRFGKNISKPLHV